MHEIREAIDKRDRLVLVVGPAAVTSDYVEAEWREALELGKPVNPVLRRGRYDLLPGELKLLDVPDFRDDAAQLTWVSSPRTGGAPALGCVDRPPVPHYSWHHYRGQASS